MTKANKILAIYSILVSLCTIDANFLTIGQVLMISPLRVISNLLILALIIVFSVLVIIYLKKHGK